MNTAVQYDAELAHVREVSLRGTADPAFWTDRLMKEELVPAEQDGKAQLLIVAADARFLGVRFREVSFSVLVSRPGAGAFLVRAFNSCRLFAFCERVLFATPYDPADVRVSASWPAAVRLVRGREEVFRAEMGGPATGPGREPSRSGEDGWAGPVFLPGSRRGRGSSGHVFFANIHGPTRTYPFLPAEDAMVIRPSPDAEIFQALIDSQFVGQEWAVREDATHAKSKTYKRSDVLAGRPPG